MDKFVYALNLIVDLIDNTDIINEHEISNYLLSTGFDDHEIRQIIALLGIGTVPVVSGFRVFSKKEKQLFTTEALNYLHKLLLSGILDFISAEEIIDHISEEGGYKINVDQLKEITLLTILEKQADIYKKSDDQEDIYH
ncbi:MAG: DUF494 family protein [Deferribacterales bacterium]|nr:DUF494 family protein [Deferribacterales bacterium]